MPASASSWSNKASLAGYIAPRGRILVSNYDLNEHQISMSGGFASGGGHLRLVKDGVVADILAWGNAAEPLGRAVETQNQTVFKRMVTEDGYFYLNKDNSLDWFASESPTPEHNYWTTDNDDNVPASVVEREKISSIDSSTLGATDQPDNKKSEAALSVAKVDITELFPDPNSPQTDADNEFVEVFNPNKTSVDLTGYSLLTGKDYSTKQIMDGITIKPNEYIVLESSSYNISLSNSGSAVRLLNSKDEVVSEVAYPKALTGESWSLGPNGWNWQTPTPGAANKARKQEPSQSNSSTQLLGAQTTVGTAASNTDGSRNYFEDPQKQEVAPIDMSVLVGVGTLAVLYAGYEYRHDFRNRFQQCRRYFQARRANRT